MTGTVHQGTHPMQPVERDTRGGRVRFKKNAIVEHLLDAGGFDMNALAMMPFSDEDRAQFAQLIGYSVVGWCDLSYVSDEQASEALAAAEALANV